MEFTNKPENFATAGCPDGFGVPLDCPNTCDMS